MLFEDFKLHIMLFFETAFNTVFEHLIMYQCDPNSPNIEIELELYKKWNNKIYI